MALREIIKNHVDEKELTKADLNEINFTHALDFYDKESGISRFVLIPWDMEFKPRETETVRIVSEKHILDMILNANVNDQDYEINVDKETKGIVISFNR